jgi:Ca-activated chloride channel family protein
MMAPSGVFRPDLITNSRALRAAVVASAGLAVLLAGSSTGARAQFASGVNVVEVYATVTDVAGVPVKGLTRDDFTVRENGRPQQISTFAAGEFPLAAAVAIDRSFSMTGERLAAARSAARVFLGELRPDDESMVIAVGSTIDIVSPLSRDRSPQLVALSRLDAFGTTGLHDAIIAAIDAIQEARGRRALVLLSDGNDRYSTASAADALARARASDVLVYPVAFGRSRPPLFAELAALTGGRSYHIEDARRLPDTLRAIARELRSQYLLGYSPATPIVSGSGEWRSIEVRVDRPGATVRARDGYVAK